MLTGILDLDFATREKFVIRKWKIIDVMVEGLNL